VECPVAELLAPTLTVGFQGEQGIDAGGLSKDWFDSVARALAEGSATGGPLAMAPDGALVPGPVRGSGALLVAGLRGLLATGRFLALAVLRECPLPILLSSLTCKNLLLMPLCTEDVCRFDHDFFHHRVERTLREEGVAELQQALCEPATFVSAPNSFHCQPQELLPGGEQIEVAEDNKHEYLRLLCESHLCGFARKELSCFLEGFWDLLPLELLRRHDITPQELSALISGSGSPDPSEWRRHSRTASNCQVIEWFWEALHELTPAQRSLLLRFVTGSSRPPPAGFSDLRPPFTVDVSSCGSPEHLPQAHTCTNRLVLHSYTSKAQLLRKLQSALSTEGFGLV